MLIQTINKRQISTSLIFKSITPEQKCLAPNSQPPLPYLPRSLTSLHLLARRQIFMCFHTHKYTRNYIRIHSDTLFYVSMCKDLNLYVAPAKALRATFQLIGESLDNLRVQAPRRLGQVQFGNMCSSVCACVFICTTYTYMYICTPKHRFVICLFIFDNDIDAVVE